jgi:hypothetical protein
VTLWAEKLQSQFSQTQCQFVSKKAVVSTLEFSLKDGKC